MDKVFDIPCVLGSEYNVHGLQYSIFRGSKSVGTGFNIPSLGSQNTMGKGARYSMGRGKISLIVSSIYHG